MPEIKCTKCGVRSTSQDWDKTTVAAGRNRKERRSCVSIEKLPRDRRVYRCPSCLEWNNGSKL